MKRKRLKPFVKVSITVTTLIVIVTVLYFVVKNNNNNLVKAPSDYTYVNDYIFDSYYPVISQDEKIIKPYVSDKVSVYKSFYEQDDTEENQKNSIIYHEGIYMQNSGVDYKSDEEFDVISSLSGTVTNVTDDALLGKTVEIRNSTELVLTYQSLNDVAVKKGDTVTQGQIIGKSGTCKLNSDVKNGLHFEMYKNGTVINPLKFFDKSVKDLSDN